MLRIQLLGHLQVTHDAVTLTHLLRPRAQRLLVYLLLHRHTSLNRDSVAFILWADQPERDALGPLRRALSDIRTSLPQDGEEWISAVGGRLRWNPTSSYWLDVEEFERRATQATPAALYSAVALYQADLLLPWDEEWVLVERERLRLRQSRALRQLVAYHRSLGEYEPALAKARQALTLDPFSEVTQRDLITLLYESGDRAAALAEYDRLSALLRDELGVEPMPETEALRVTITRGERLAAPEAPAPPAPLQEPPQVRSALIGRTVEMARLNTLWTQVAAEQGGCAIISGEAGVGKSRLAQALVDDVIRGGGLPLVGYSYEFERALPYQALVDMLRSAAPVLPAMSLSRRTMPLSPVSPRISLTRLAAFKRSRRRPKRRVPVSSRRCSRHSWRWRGGSPCCCCLRMCTGRPRPPWIGSRTSLLVSAAAVCWW